nr:1,6-anhydro-N-acetylmuramyl-L-alanine amidase AmpD [uncultured Undibacterium sp.]
MLTRINPFSLAPAQADAWDMDAQGWCLQVQPLASPNFGQRPAQMAISMLVIHNISLPLGQFGSNYIAELFQNTLNCDAHSSFASLRGLQVSSHFLILRDGRVQQFVSALDRAWHAGISHFQGREGCNDFSIGIELEGCDSQPFEDAQYMSLLKLSQALLRHFPIEHIVGHDEIAPGRKTDPGPYFDWARYQQALGAWHIN